MEKLLAACTQLPPDFAYIRSILESDDYSPETISMVMLKYADKYCWLEVSDFIYENRRFPEKHEVHSAYIYELAELMLEFGFDPNLILDYEGYRDGFMNQLDLVDYNYIAADTMRLLLEHGADLNIMFESQTRHDILYEYMVLDVDYGFVGEVTGENNHLYDWQVYDSKFHLLLVLIGYGAKLSGGYPSIVMKDGYSTDVFRQHERFDFRIEYDKEVRGDWTMHIFDRNTGEDVATI